MVIAKKSTIGMGLFANANFKKGDIVSEVTGEIVTDLIDSYEYYIDIGDNEAMDPSEPCCYINHSCSPNCAFTYSDPENPGDKKRMFIEAILDINKGDELFTDYSWPPESAIPCLCGSPNCRGWIVAKDQVDCINQETAYS